jgi:replicative DNA helicase
MADVKGWLNDQSASTGAIVAGKTRIPVSATQYPSDEQAERALLGAILLIGQSPSGKTESALSQISNVTFEDFFFRRNGIVYLAMLALNKSGKHVDLQSLATQLRSAKTNGIDFLQQVGGEDYLVTLMNSAKGIDVRTYAEQLIEISLRRALMFQGQRSQVLATDSGRSLSELLDEANTSSRDIARRLMNMRHKNTYSLEDVVEARAKQVIEEAENPNYIPGITSGIKDLDEGILYFQPGRGYVFAAPSGWGKTIAMGNFALAAAKEGKRVVYITMEMSANEFTDRMICMFGHINYEHYQTREMTPEEIGRLRGAYTNVLTLLGAKMITLVEMTLPTLDEIEAKLYELSLDPGFDMVIIDYLKADKLTVDGDERTATVDIFKRWEKWKKADFASATHITATQINRGDTDSREDYTMDRLYGSTIIQNVADLVIFIYREDKILAHEYVEPYIYMEFLVAKGRNVKFQGDIKAILDDDTLLLRNRFEPVGEP